MEPIFISDEEYEKIEDAILGISDAPPDVKYVTELPKSFDKYMEKNRERIAKFKSPPYWVKDNKDYVRL